VSRYRMAGCPPLAAKPSAGGQSPL